MKKYLAAVTLVAALAQPATATTFPTLTTIYVGAGVRDDGAAADLGLVTTFMCSNVSGATTDIRFLVLNAAGGLWPVPPSQPCTGEPSPPRRT